MDKIIIKKFIETFKNHTQHTEIRASGQEIRQFLKENDISLTFQAFNKLTRCKGRTTHNLYAYDLTLLYNTLSDEPPSKQTRTFPSNRIKTIGVYGSKRRWWREWETLLMYCQGLGCSALIDCFGGSGFISLTASKLNLFDYILLNEVSTRIFNFHCVLKDTRAFYEFIKRLEETSYLTKRAFDLLKDDFYNLAGGVVYANSEKAHKRQLQTLSVEDAFKLYCIKHYSFNSQGAYVEDRKKLSDYITALRHTHNLYKNCNLKSLYYKKLLLEYIENTEALIVLDPPYLHSTRSQTSSYEVEFSERQHRTLIKLLSEKQAKAKIILCGYKENENDLYTRYLKRSKQSWHCIRFKRSGKLEDLAGGKEHIWVNFEVEELINSNTDYFEFIW